MLVPPYRRRRGKLQIPPPSPPRCGCLLPSSGSLLHPLPRRGSGKDQGGAQTCPASPPLPPKPHPPSTYVQALALLNFYLTDDVPCSPMTPKAHLSCNPILGQSMWGGLTAVCIWFGQSLHIYTGILASSRMKGPKKGHMASPPGPPPVLIVRWMQRYD